MLEFDYITPVFHLNFQQLSELNDGNFVHGIKTNFAEIKVQFAICEKGKHFQKPFG